MNLALFLFPWVFHAFLMFIDEFYFHHRRGLPLWERIGHPLDTITVLVCIALAAFLPNSQNALPIYITASVFSTLFITKDEWIHHKHSTGGELWLHSLLFALHPVLLALAWLARVQNVQIFGTPFLAMQLGLLFVFLAYQFFYWNVFSKNPPEQVLVRPDDHINLGVYNTLGTRWYTADNDPIALLRAESNTIAPWVLQHIRKTFKNSPAKILDIGCGAGFLSNKLAKASHNVWGLDLSTESLEVARTFDSTKSVQYIRGDAYELPFEDAQFDVVCLMDFLEHVEDMDSILKQASRVLKPGGLLFFHTFNRNPISWLVALKGVEWLVQNVPKNLHLYRLFRKPTEVTKALQAQRLQTQQLTGLAPKLFSKAFLKLLVKGRVASDFKFKTTPSTQISYLGVAIQN